MVELIELNKAFGKNKVLNNINLRIERGFVYGLIGKNGVGKTTLINLIVDLIPPDSGKILICNKEHNKLNKSDKKNIGVVGENLALIEEISGLEYLKFVGKIYELSKNNLIKRIDDLFGYFFDDKFDLKKNISNYSTGMKKKIAFCAAVLHTPDLLILDEPFSGLDPFVANQMVAFLKLYKKNNRSIIVSSHDLAYLEKIATHIGVLNDKHLQFNSTLQDFTEHGESSIDKALLKILKPGDTDLTKIDWI